MSTAHVQRCRILAQGQVQGVGFRPFVYRLAVERSLTGYVGNTSEGVHIEIQGSSAALDSFLHALQSQLPPLARLTACHSSPIPPLAAEEAFCITASHGHSGHSVLISPDMGICHQCMDDMRDPQNRRYHYPFTNCTNCGPRYTITRAIPYDRATTSMACFPLCPQCQYEYDNPLDRRFHAQPNACPQCGPTVWCAAAQEGKAFLDGQKTSLLHLSSPGFFQGNTTLVGQESMVHVAQRLKEGRIVAMKGLGGFHLVCDAMNQEAVAELRRRKHRPHKALAVMVPDLTTARLVAVVGEMEEALLTAPEKPIVLCESRGMLPKGIAPDVGTVGLVLPYTPLHLTLFDFYKGTLPVNTCVALVMTSGNAGGEPICLGNREALTRLAGIADVFLLHNRDILVRCDDSVLAPSPSMSLAATIAPVTPSRHAAPCVLPPKVSSSPPKLSSPPLFYRRARGFVPTPVVLDGAGPSVMGMGPELKSTVCITRGSAAFVSQHVGDLQNVETLGFHREVAAHLEMLLETRAQGFVCDAHPDFLSTAEGEAMAAQRGVPCLRLQHHFAHGWSVLADNGYAGRAVVLALDGTGWGDDGTVWGGELLGIDTQGLEQRRLGRLRPFALPGGDKAVREPWRVALGLAHDRYQRSEFLSFLKTEAGVPMVLEMLAKGLNCPRSSSAGRLFDAVAAGLGLCTRTSYEGQAAIRLEAAQAGLGWTGEGSLEQGYGVELAMTGDLWEMDSQALFLAAMEERGGVALAARRFHVGLAMGLVHMAARAAEQWGTSTVGLSGGVMQNRTLAAVLPWLLKQRGLTPLTHKNIPAHDGGVSLGQAAWGRRVLLG